MAGQRTVLIGFEVVLQFDGAIRSYGGADRGRLDGPHATRDSDLIGTHRHGDIRYDYSRWYGCRQNNGGRYGRQWDSAQVAGCVRVSGGYPTEISLEEWILDVPPRAVRGFADDLGRLPGIQYHDH